jgi:CspA family cold shock protein
MGKKMKGKVKFFNSEKEFGFIIGEDGKDYFVHKTGLQDGVTIDKDDAVTFEAEKGDKGMKAVKVSKN